MAAIINPRDILLINSSPRLASITLPSNIVINAVNVDGLPSIIDSTKRLWLSASSLLFQISKSSVVSPSSITITANLRNLTGSPTLSISSGSLSISPVLTGGSFVFTETQMLTDTLTFELSLIDGGVTYSDKMTFVKVREGVDALIGALTNMTHSVPSDNSGNVLSYVGASGVFNLWKGASDVRTLASFSVASGGNPNNLSVSIVASGANAGSYSVTGGFPAGVDTAEVTFNAVFGGVTFPLKFTLTKSKQGSTGPQGLPGSGQITWTKTSDMSVSGNTFTKTSGVSGWNGSIYSDQKYSGGCYLSFSPSQTYASLMIGLNTDPPTDNSYSSLDFAVYIRSDSNFVVYESGNERGVFGQYTTNDIFEIRHVNNEIKYYRNGSVFRTVSNVNNSTFFALDSSFYDVFSSVRNVVFAPLPPSGENGLSAPSIVLVTDSYMFKYDGSNNPLPSSQTITIESVIKNLSGSPTWEAKAFDSNGSYIGLVNLTNVSATVKTIDVSTFDGYYTVRISATLGGLTDYLTIGRVKDGSAGANGQSALSFKLTNENHGFSADSNGNVSSGEYTGASTGLIVYEGTSNVSSAWDFTFTTSTGVTASKSGAVLSITNFSNTVDSGYVDITPFRTGYQSPPALRMTLTKSKSSAGTSGVLSGSGWIDDFDSSSPYSMTASVQFKSDGTCSITQGEGSVTNWYAPQTTGIGNSYWIRFSNRGDSGYIGTYGQILSLSSPKTVGKSSTLNSSGEVYYTIFSDSSGNTPVGNGSISITLITGQ